MQQDDVAKGVQDSAEQLAAEISALDFEQTREQLTARCRALADHFRDADAREAFDGFAEPAILLRWLSGRLGFDYPPIELELKSAPSGGRLLVAHFPYPRSGPVLIVPIGSLAREAEGPGGVRVELTDANRSGIVVRLVRWAAEATLLRPASFRAKATPGEGELADAMALYAIDAMFVLSVPRDGAVDIEDTASGEQPVGGALRASHSPDFSTVDWYGTRYTFARGNQREAVRVLWQAWAGGGHALSQETIAEQIKSAAERFSLRHTFRDRRTGKQHLAWGTMIREADRGTYALFSQES